MDFYPEDDTRPTLPFNQRRKPKIAEKKQALCCRTPEWLSIILKYILPPLYYMISDVFDLVSDVLVAIELHQPEGSEESNWPFGLTVAFILAPAFLFGIFAVFTVIQTENQSCTKKLGRIGFYLLAVCSLSLWPIYSFLKMFYYGMQALIDRKRREEYIEKFGETSRSADLTTQQMLRAFVESAPQLLLQLYLLMREPLENQNATTITVQAVSIAFSLISLTNTVVQFHDEGERDRALATGGEKEIAELESKVCCSLTEYLWWFLSIAARVSALALFASVFHFWVFAVGLGHVVVMTTCILINQKEGRSFIVAVWVGIIYIFCFVEYKGNFSKIGKVISLYILYYCFTLPQNAAMVFCAYFLAEDKYDYHYTLVVAHFVATTLSLIFMVCYLGLLQPFLRMKHKATVVRTTSV